MTAVPSVFGNWLVFASANLFHVLSGKTVYVLHISNSVHPYFVTLSPGQTRKHCCGNVVSCRCFVMFPGVGKLGNSFRETLARTNLKVLFMFAL